MAFQGENIIIFGFNTGTYFSPDELKIMKDFNPDVINVIGVCGAEYWLDEIGNKKIIEHTEIMPRKIKKTFYHDLENHAINLLYDYFINKGMFMEAFDSLKFLDNDLTQQKKYLITATIDMVNKIIDVIDSTKKTIIICPWKIISPTMFGNLIGNLNNTKPIEFNKPLCMVLDEDDINTHKVSVINLISEKKIVDNDIYNHLLSMLIKIWILEHNNKKVEDNFSDTKIFCLNMILQYLYNNNRINDIFYVWEFYKFDIDMNNSHCAYVLLYYSKYLSKINDLETANKYVARAIELNQDIEDLVNNVIKNYKN